MKSALLALVLFGSAGAVLSAQTMPATNPAAAEAAAAISNIHTAMDAQAEAWNRADVDAFMEAYEDSPDTTFIGMTVRKGFKPILERYKQAYSTAEQMGKLSFTDVDVRLLPGACGKSELALVTGKFHLERTARGEAKKDDGIFSLVWRKGPKGWKIILDHTS
jgi:ketosteroid isomerase-like protein